MTSTSYPDTKDASWLESLAEQPLESQQPTTHGDGDRLWWPIALSEAVKADKPLGVSLGDRPMVLWRDAQGLPRAIIDRCPHRRVPLSLGRVTSDGLIQCGYHGWCYEGQSGRVSRIPNMLDKQRFPPIYRAESYGVHESGGFIRVCLDKDAPPPRPDADRLPLHGTTLVTLGHAHYVAMLFDNPALLIRMPGVEITEYLASELTWADNVATLDRHCAHRLHIKALRERSRFPFVLRVQADLVTGEAKIRLIDDSSCEIARIDLAPTPSARGTTMINWRTTARSGLIGKLRGSTPVLQVRGDPDVASIVATRPSVSVKFATKLQTAP